MSSEDDRQERPQPEYEPPRAEDVDTKDTPSVTAAGKSQGPGSG